MSSMTVRNIPDDAKLRFRQIAAAHGRSMEEHLRQMIVEAGFDDGPPSQGVRDMNHSFRHFEPVETAFVSTGSAVIDELLRLGRGLEFEAPEREPFGPHEFAFDPKDFT